MGSTKKLKKHGTFGDRVTKRMSELGLELNQVADATGVTPSGVTEWRKGRATPSTRDKMVALTKILKTTESWLFGETDDHPPVEVEPNAKIVLFPFSDVPSVGAAAAGPGRAYEDLDYGERVFAEGLRDPNAIAIEVEGDSMAPEFKPGERIVVDTKSDLISGKPAVVKDSKENVYFKLYYPESSGAIRLKSINPAYPDIVLRMEDITWIYKAHGRYQLL